MPNHITNQDLLTALNNLANNLVRLELKMETKMDELEFRVEDKARERHNEVLSKFDAWAGELSNAQEARELSTKRLNDLEKTTKNHEKRIKKLEHN